jgi:hypothetical protein
VSEDVLARIREIAARAAAAAPADAEPPAAGAHPAPHWSEADRDPEAPAAAGRAAGLSLRGEITARRTACSALRKLLAGGGWHSALELVEVGGLRYGGRLYEIRRGLDGGPPLDVEGEAREQGRRWFYRIAPAPAAPRQAEFPGNFDFPAPEEKPRG